MFFKFITCCQMIINDNFQLINQNLKQVRDIYGRTLLAYLFVSLTMFPMGNMDFYNFQCYRYNFLVAFNEKLIKKQIIRL